MSKSAVNVAGACAVGYTLTALTAVGLYTQAGLLEAERAVDLLPILVDHRAPAMAAGWLMVLAPLLMAAAGLGLREMLRKQGASISAALAAFVGAALLALLRNVLWLAMTYEIGPAYVAASPSDQTMLAAVGDTLLRYGFILGDLTGGFLGGVGIALFSAAILQTKLAPRWVGWLGLAVAATNVILPIVPLLPALEPLVILGFPGFAVWMVAMGIRLWRQPTSPTAASAPA